MDAIMIVTLEVMHGLTHWLYPTIPIHESCVHTLPRAIKIVAKLSTLKKILKNTD